LKGENEDLFHCGKENEKMRRKRGERGRKVLRNSPGISCSISWYKSLLLAVKS